MKRPCVEKEPESRRGVRPCSSVRHLRSFTLIELLVTVLIIVLLAGLLMPALIAARNYARTSKARAEVREIAKAWEAYWDLYRLLPGMPEMTPEAVEILQGRGHAANTNDVQFMAFSRREEANGARDPWGNRYRLQPSSDVIQRETLFNTRVYMSNRHRNR